MINAVLFFGLAITTGMQATYDRFGATTNHKVKLRKPVYPKKCEPALISAQSGSLAITPQNFPVHFAILRAERHDQDTK